MSDSTGSEIGAFFAGFVIGGLVGGAAALLLAPHTGKETRDQIRVKSVEVAHRAEGVMGDAVAKAEAVAADVKRRAEDLQMRSRVVLEEGQKQLAQAVEGTKQAARAAASNVPVGEAAETVEASEA